MQSKSLTAALVILSLLLWVAAAGLAQDIGRQTERVSARLEGGVDPATLAQGTDAIAADGGLVPPCTLWSEENGKTVTAGENTALATENTLWGDCGDLAPPPVTGSFPGRGDTGVCAVDAALAFALWGGTDVVGKELELDGRAYTVQGVFPGTAGRIMRQVEEGSGQALPRLEIGCGTRGEAELFLTKLGVGGAVLLDKPLMGWLASLLASLPGLIIGLGALGRLWSGSRRLHGAPLMTAGYLAPAALLGAATAWAMSLPAVPDALIPTKWSDFAFWQAVFSRSMEHVEEWLSQPGTVADNELWKTLGLCLLTVAVCLPLLAAALARTRQVESRQVVPVSLALAFILLAGVYVTGAVISPEMLALPALWVAAAWYSSRPAAWMNQNKEVDADDCAPQGENPVREIQREDPVRLPVQG